MQQRWKVGSVSITKIVEIEMASSARWLLPQATRENLLQVPWLQPHFCNAEGRVLMSVHMFVIEADGMRIAVDTCIGNDKRRSIPTWDSRQGPFLQDLERAGFPTDSIDRVLCTHLHVDHVGWNTRLQDGAWVPTFPRARYLFGRAEFEHWSRADSGGDQAVLQDSVQPVVDAGLVDLVDGDHALCGSVALEPTPGHTPGHVSVYIRSQGEQAVITGDMLHHPVQCAHPEWSSSADADAARAIETRRTFLARHAGTPTLVLGTHFATPTAGRIVRDGDGYRLDC